MAKNKRRQGQRRAKPVMDGGAASATAEALERFKPLLPEAEWSLLLAELDQPFYSAVRMNPLKVQPEQALQEYATRYGWEVKRVPFCPTGWWVEAAATSPGQTLEHRLGNYYIQDAASMLPVELFDFDPQAQPLILDMAASPGGKTTHLIARSMDRGLVIANDSSAGRIQALRVVLEGWGALGTAVTRFPGEKFGGWFPETFDAILLDAPCSMQGLRSTDAHPMRPITARERSGLAQRQLHLLESGFSALKVGGQMVYSTCTLEPDEDEGVLDGLLRRYGSAVRVDDLGARLPVPAESLTRAGESEFHPDVRKAARLWPHRFHTAGFFAARITKLDGVEPTSSAGEPAPARPLARAGLQPLHSREVGEIAARLMDAYGLDLPALLEAHNLEVWRYAGELLLVPGYYAGMFNHMPVQGLGLTLAEETPAGLLLDHFFLARFLHLIRQGVHVVADDARAAAWLRGEDLHGTPPEGAVKGDILILVDAQNRLLGRARVQAERLKNLLPRRAML